MAGSDAPPREGSVVDLLPGAVLSPERISGLQAAWPHLPGLDRWSRDPDVGLIERSYVVPGRASPGYVPELAGQDGRAVVATIDADGARRRTRYATAPRINSYGDSFTHGDQVDDHETWQERLGQRLLEPIRNFGLGGGSVFQTFRRMRKEEIGTNAGEYVLFYLWGDDHLRSILGGAYPVLGFLGNARMQYAGVAHPHLSMDLASGDIRENEAAFPSPESVAVLGDLDWLVHRFASDPVVQLVLYGGHPANRSWGPRIDTIDEAAADRLAEILDFSDPWRRASDRRAAARELLDRYSLRATIHVIDSVLRFADAHGRRVMFLLLDPFRSVPELLDTGTRYDQVVVDHLRDVGATSFDMTRIHVDESRARGEAWARRRAALFVPGARHYNPAGNEFFAASLEPRLVDLLGGRLDPGATLG